MVDSGRVVALLERVLAEVKALRRAAARGDDHLLSDDDALPAAKYRLLVAIEASIDAADHIIASEGLRPSQTLADSFASLADGGWISPDLARSLQDAARFRNLLVHQYADVDDRRVIELMRTRLADLDEYCAVISRGLEREI